ncbi:hypothetical protein ACN2WE_40860 [Streptomyces sp. cg28]|uniref:hypothetical protein n=1 Tax=Streptomyces sp. cg28 TaxID=3403457 RepID=UPI003B20D518
MNFWNEPDSSSPVHRTAADVAFERWRLLRGHEASALAEMCACRLAVGDEVLEHVPMGRPGVRAHVREQLAKFVEGRGISVGTADQYRRVSAWYTADRRTALTGSSTTASYSVLREVALYTRGEEVSDQVRFQRLLDILNAAAADGALVLSCRDYLERCGLTARSSPSAGLPGQTVGVPVPVQGLAVPIESAVRALVADPAGPERFFEELASEGGLEALRSASSALRKTAAETRRLDVAVFGSDEPAGPLEETLSLVVRAMKALQKPLDIDPRQIVQALPPEQFAALSELCGSIHHWHELLIRAARASAVEKGTAA